MNKNALRAAMLGGYHESIMDERARDFAADGRVRKPLKLTYEQLRIISGSGMCSTGAPSGTCPTGSNYCGGKTL